MGMSQMCTGAGDYFRTSKPHSEKLCDVLSIYSNECSDAENSIYFFQPVLQSESVTASRRSDYISQSGVPLYKLRKRNPFGFGG